MPSAFELTSGGSSSAFGGNQGNTYTGPNGQVLRKAQGGWYIGPGGEQIWDPVAYFKKKQDSNQTLSVFMASNAGKTSSTPFDPAVSQYKGQLDAYLAQRGPQMDTSNRFEAGLSANERRLNALLEDPNAIQQTAAYKFRVGQGQEALNRNLAAKGLLGSGNRLMELTKYGQEMGSQEYENQSKRLSDLVGMYSGNWLGDKSANTAKFAAESNAWNQRGGLLGNIYGKTGALANQRAGIQSSDALGWASAYNKLPDTRSYMTGSQAPGAISPFSVIR